MKPRHSPIPKTWPVKPLKKTNRAVGLVECYNCGLCWDDDVVTSMTPAPSGRCPFEAFHLPAPEAKPVPDLLTHLRTAVWYWECNLPPDAGPTELEDLKSAKSALRILEKGTT